MKTLRTELREATVCVMAFGNDREGNGFVLHERKYALELAELAIRLDNACMESEDTPAWARELHQFAEFSLAKLAERIDGVEQRLAGRMDGFESRVTRKIETMDLRIGERLDKVESTSPGLQREWSRDAA